MARRRPGGGRGGVFVGLLKAAVPPLVFTAIVVSVGNLRQVTNAARLAGQTLLWFMITSLVSVAIGIGLGLLTHPGRSAEVSAAGATYEGASGSWLDFLTGLVPANFLGLSVTDGSPSFSVLQIVVLALAVGAATLRAGETAEPLAASSSMVDREASGMRCSVVRPRAASQVPQQGMCRRAGRSS